MRTITASWKGTRLSSGRYQIVSELGAGGMGTVYRAHDGNLDTDVVIKVPHLLMLQHDEDFVHRFQQEIRSLVHLSHPHIVKILDVGEHEGIPFAVMQYLAGGSLADSRPVAADGCVQPVSPTSLGKWLPEVARALDFVHRKGYVHRDIKPGNILFDGDRNSYISDFGVAKVISDSAKSGQTRNLTGTGMVLGTAEYMAPELIQGHAYDGRSDQYSLALTVYELLAGRAAFQAATPAAIMIEKATKNAPPLRSIAPHILSKISDALERAMERDPARRFASSQAFAEAILSPGNERPVPLDTGGVSQQREQPVVSHACPQCGRKLKLPPALAGKEAICPKCNAALKIAADLSTLQPRVSLPPPRVFTAAPSTPPPRPPVQQPTPHADTSRAQMLLDTRANFAASLNTQTKINPNGRVIASWRAKSLLLFGSVGLVGLGLALFFFIGSLILSTAGDSDAPTLSDEIRAWQDEYTLKDTTKGFLDSKWKARLPSWRKAAEKGDPAAQVLVADCYEMGIGLTQDKQEAFRLYRAAADKDYAVAQCSVGWCYQYGIGVEKDETEAAKWYRKAADQGEPLGQLNLGHCFAFGKGVPKDEKLACAWYQRAAVSGNLQGQMYVGNCYYAGAGVAEDKAEAVRWYRKAAEQGYRAAQCNLGRCCEDGLGIEEDKREAVQWYRKAAEQGYPSAQYHLGRCYEDGLAIVEDKREAVQWYRKAAEQEDARAQREVGLCYDLGEGVSVNDAEAVRWYRRAAEKGDSQGQYLLATMYENGEGVGKDDRAAAGWYRKAAEQTYAPAQMQLGECYDLGEGVAKDHSEAVRWYRMAADQGNRQAQNLLGMKYTIGVGIAKDDNQAFMWFQRSAEQNYPPAQFNLGVCYEDGAGVRKDDGEATKWYRKAASQGYQPAKDAIAKKDSSSGGALDDFLGGSENSFFNQVEDQKRLTAKIIAAEVDKVIQQARILSATNRVRALSLLGSLRDSVDKAATTIGDNRLNAQRQRVIDAIRELEAANSQGGTLDTFSGDDLFGAP